MKMQHSHQDVKINATRKFDRKRTMQKKELLQPGEKCKKHRRPYTSVLKDLNSRPQEHAGIKYLHRDRKNDNQPVDEINWEKPKGDKRKDFIRSDKARRTGAI